jgi:hypothetical protein
MLNGLISDAHTILSKSYTVIGELGVKSIDEKNAVVNQRNINKLITCTNLYQVVMRHVILSDDGTEIVGTKDQDVAIINQLLIQLKKSAGLYRSDVFPTPLTTYTFNFSGNGNGNGSGLPPGMLGDMLYHNGTEFTTLSGGVPGYSLVYTPTGPQWQSVVGNGIPSGGSTGQVLRKVNNSSYNTYWDSLSVEDLAGITASTAEVNILTGVVGVSNTEINYLANVTSDIQNQFLGKLGTALTTGSFYVGVSNIATAVAPSGDVTFNTSGVFSISAGAILDADINSSAAIARTKFASGSANRIVINDASGVMVDAPAILPDRVVISDANGIPIASTVTITTLGYLDASSSIQTQINERLAVNLTSPTQGDMLFFNGTDWVNFAVGSAGQVITSDGTNPIWGSAAANGLPTGGAANEYLRKIDGTNFNTEWHQLITSDLTDLSATSTELNLLSGLTVDSTLINLLTGATDNIQDQLNNRLPAVLTYHSIFVGGPGDTPQQVSAGLNGSVLTIVSGHPTWQIPPAPGNVSGPVSSTDNALARWNGTAGDSIQDSGITLGDDNFMFFPASTGINTGTSNGNTFSIKVYKIGTGYENALITTAGAFPTVDLHTNATVGGAAIYRVGGTDVSLADGGTGASLASPGVNAVFVWDNTTVTTRLAAISGLTYDSGTNTLSSSGSSLTSTYVGYGNGSNVLTGEAAFTYNATDNILTVPRLHLTAGSDPVSTVTDGDLIYNSTDLDLRGRINGVWTSLTRPGLSSIDNTDSPYTVLESERNYITYVDTTAGAVTIDLVARSTHWVQQFVNTGTGTFTLDPNTGITLNAVDDTCSTQYGAVTVVYAGANTYYAFGALGTGGGGGGSGTVTSFSAGTLSPLFTTSVATATTTPALSFTLTSQSANRVFAGPTAGGSAAPTFRLLVADDIPDLSSSYWTLASGGTLTGDNVIEGGVNMTLGSIASPLIGLESNVSSIFQIVVTNAGEFLFDTSGIYASSFNSATDKIAILSISSSIDASEISYNNHNDDLDERIPAFAITRYNELTAGSQDVVGYGVDLSFKITHETSVSNGNEYTNAIGFSFSNVSSIATKFDIEGYAAGSQTEFLTIDGNLSKQVRAYGPVKLMNYITGALPAAASHQYAIAYDTTTGSIKYSDGSTWIAVGVGGGSVTSVALAAPSFLSVSGSPITSSGTITLSLATQTANTVFAGPTTGGAAAPTFRALVASDIPDLSATYQPLDDDLTAIAALGFTSSALLRKTAANTWTLDTTTYLTTNQTITLSGQATGSGSTSIAVTLDNAAVIGKVLTGYTSGAGTVAATDTILQAIQKLDGNASTKWSLASGGTLTGVNTITSNANAQLTFGGTWTATANSQYHWIINPILTARATASDTLYAMMIAPTLNATANTQNLVTLDLTSTYNQGVFSNVANIGIRTNGRIEITADSALRFILQNSGSATGMNFYQTTTLGASITMTGSTAADPNALVLRTDRSTGNMIFATATNTKAMFIDNAQRVGIGVFSSLTAKLHLAAGSATASTAPLKFTSGTNLTTPESGAVEFDGTNLYFSVSTVRYTLMKVLTASATLDFPSTLTQEASDLTITVTGAALNDEVVLGVPNGSVNANSGYFAWVSAADTVTVRFMNFSSGSINPASGTFKVSVHKR